MGSTSPPSTRLDSPSPNPENLLCILVVWLLGYLRLAQHNVSPDKNMKLKYLLSVSLSLSGLFIPGPLVGGWQFLSFFFFFLF